MMLSIVIPTYKRASAIEGVVQRLLKALDQLDFSYEVILVDDASGDGTDEVILALAETYSPIKAICLEANVGQQNATLAGLRAARGSMIITMDDDLRHSLRSIRQMMDCLDQGYDIVYGIPPYQNNGLIRLLGSQLKEGLFFMACGKPLGLRLSSYRIMNRDALKWVNSDPVEKVYISARILQRKHRIAMIHVLSEQGLILPSNYTLKKLMKLIWQVFSNYSRLGRVLGLRRNGNQYVIKEKSI